MIAKGPRTVDDISPSIVAALWYRSAFIVNRTTLREATSDLMEPLLLTLLTSLEAIGEQHGELYDSEVRERMGNAVMDGFVRNAIGCIVPADLGMFTDVANAAVREVLCQYIDSATSAAGQLGITTFHGRLAAFQNSEIRTKSRTPIYYDDLFGYAPPEWYDPQGKVIWDRVK